MTTSPRPSRIRGRQLLAAGCLTVLAGTIVVPAAAEDAAEQDSALDGRYAPIGGGYHVSTLEGFSAEAARGADDGTVDLYVIPATYGDDPADREENLVLAQERADQIHDACLDVVGTDLTCRTTLLPILQREDALDTDVSAPLREDGVDGMYVLGGDQVLAMQILANSPAEEAMEEAFTGGAVVGGTSAGNAVESRSMGAGYPAEGYPENALERDMSLIFWGDDLASDERGLSFGSQDVIFDQHFYERGRFGRLLSWVGQSVERYGEDGKVGIGVDWGTGLVLADDVAGDAFGVSSTVVVDAAPAQEPTWVGPRDTLSHRGLNTHLIAPGTPVTYDTTAREVSVDGSVVPLPDAAPLPSLAVRGSGQLWVGGGQNDSADSAALGEFVAAAGEQRPGHRPLLVVPVGGADTELVDGYVTALVGAGWAGTVEVVPASELTSSRAARANGVLVVGADQAELAPAVDDSGLIRSLRQSISRGTPTMTDGAASALLGETYVADHTPGSAENSLSDDAIAMFRADEVDTRDGAGLLPGVLLEPENTEDYRWGRLYGAAYDRPEVVSVGISELTALRIDSSGARVVGERSTVLVDGRGADWFTGDNGALGAVHVRLDVLGPGDHLR